MRKEVLVMPHVLALELVWVQGLGSRVSGLGFKVQGAFCEPIWGLNPEP